MKTLLYLIILTIFVISCSIEDFKDISNARLHYDLNGPVKSITFETFKVDSFTNGEIIAGKRSKCKRFNPTILNYLTDNYSLVFTENGDTKEIKVFGSRGNINNKYTAIYNKNQLIESESIDFSTNKTTTGERYYSDNKIEAIAKNEENKVITKMTLHHDSSNRLTATETLDSQGNLLATAKYKYKGDIRIAKFYNENRKLTSTVKTNSKGKTIEEISNQKMYLKYDNKDFLESIIVKNKISKNILYKYINDENGYVIDAKKWKDKVLIDSFRFEYEFDQNKNWTKRVMFEDDNPIAISVRKIEYYKNWR